MLQALDPTLRIAFVLGAICELEAPECAAILGTTSAAFRKRLSRARAALDAFLTGAASPAQPPAPDPPTSPWTQGRPNVIKTYVLRFPEPYHMKLQYIAAHTPSSMQRFLQEVVYAAIDQQIAELTDPP